MNTDGITSANINNSKYLLIIDVGSVGVDDDDIDSDVVLAAFWIFNPKTNEDVPIKKETIVRTFCVRPGIRATGEPWIVSCVLVVVVVVVAVVAVLWRYYSRCA